MSRQFDFERLVELCRRTHRDGIAQTVSAKSLELSKIQHTMSVETLAPSVSDVLTGHISATTSRISEGQLDAKMPARYRRLATPEMFGKMATHSAWAERHLQTMEVVL